VSEITIHISKAKYQTYL